MNSDRKKLKFIFYNFKNNLNELQHLFSLSSLRKNIHLP